MSRWISLLLALLLSHAAMSQNPAVPPALRDWQDWVLHDSQSLSCPYFLAEAGETADEHACVWPGTLNLDIQNDGAQFSIEVQVLEESWVALPGSPGLWPNTLTVDGVDVAVVTRGQRPAVELPVGRHRIRGGFAWDRLPEIINLPTEVALISVSRNGQAWPAAQRRGNQLLLSPSATETPNREVARTTLTVQRRLQDGIPLQLVTQIELDVSGPAREQVLGRALPDGFAIMNVNTGLPLRIDEQGRLIAQLRAGNHQIQLTARAKQFAAPITLPAAADVWPEQEIWAFGLNPAYRIADLGGGTAVDGRQVEAVWPDLPNYLVRAGQTLSIAERSRGLAPDERNRLSLQRQLWLDFDHGGYSVEDRIYGQMIRDFRLELMAPMIMQSASSNNEPLMITRGSQEGSIGVPALDHQLNIATTSRVETGRSTLPVHGYTQRMDQVQTTLNLPPGFRLIASGADHAPRAWIERWDVLDVFLVLVIAAACWRLLGPVWGVIAGSYLALGFHEGGLPIWSVLTLVVLIGVCRVTPASTLRKLLRFGRNLTLVGLVLITVPFVATQLRDAMFPQLEGPSGHNYYNPTAEHYFEVAQESAAPTIQVEDRAAASDEGIEEIVVTGSKVNRPRYQKDALIQAGVGRPSWQWNQYQLNWTGPIEPEQSTRLLISPRWLTALFRVIISLLLLSLVGRLLRECWPATGRWSKRLSAALVIGLVMVAPIQAQQTPNPDLLETLAERLLEPAECAPLCASIDEVAMVIDNGQLTMDLEIHAADNVAVPLPTGGDSWALTRVLVNGQAGQSVLRQANLAWLNLPPGIHQVRLTGPLKADQIALRFPSPPKWVRSVTTPGWLIQGIQNQRLTSTGGSAGLTLNRQAPVNPQKQQRGQPIQAAPLVQVRRDLSFANQWTVITQVNRIAPRQGAISIEIPLLAEEAVQTGGLALNRSAVTANFGPQQRRFEWQSQIPVADTVTLQAAERDDLVEVWTLNQSPLWQLDIAGVPRHPPGPDFTGGWALDYFPRPGETLTIRAERPEPVPGATIAIDEVQVLHQVGERTVDTTLELSLRASRAEQHVLRLPSDIEVTAVNLSGRTINVRPQQDQLTVPITAGDSRLQVQWQRADPISLRSAGESIDLGAPAANIQLRTQLPGDRWVLWTNGPQRGPAVLYWPELLVMLLLAWGLSKTTATPLRLHHWLLLGLGLSTFFWPTLALVIVWFFIVAWRGRFDPDRLPAWQFNLMQLALIVFSVVALGALVSAIPAGLLGTPDMHIRGGEGSQLGWFADRSEGSLPATSVWSVPMWWYKALMLAWALWLALALTRWLPWAWRQLIAGRAWQGKPRLLTDAAGTGAGKNAKDDSNDEHNDEPHDK